MEINFKEIVENDRLLKQINFIIELDKLKSIFRQSYLSHSKRHENDAEHSWHIAVMAILLAEHSSVLNKDPDLLKVVKMLLIHDIVEIDAGDTYCYDEIGNAHKEQRELKAAARIFNILPEDQSQELFDLWQEFEQQVTPEAVFAASLDRIQPIILNFLSAGKSWKEHDITPDMILKRNSIIEKGSPALWNMVKNILKIFFNR
ncbi:MAG: hypothetical protein APR63_10190 [Desulfuromonas sp. SDB]|nr:MAG: hypothetical protein APR63_10190 [Desulfuromonas sp. SDB]